jgi:hypothetical protein
MVLSKRLVNGRIVSRRGGSNRRTPKSFRSHSRMMVHHRHHDNRGAAYMFNVAFIFAINITILYLVMEVEKAQCMQTCKLNWRHQFVKYTSILILVCKVLCMLNIHSPFTAFISRLAALMSIINIYVLYVYMQDITENKDCTCANSDHPTLTNIVLYYSYMRVALVAIVAISAILIFLSGGTTN